MVAPRSLQHLVAGEVAVRVVDLLEMVDVEHHERQWATVPLCADDLALERLEEEALRRRLRERVGDHEAVDLLVVLGLDVPSREELEDRWAHLEPVAVAKGLLGDEPVVQERAVRGLEIDERVVASPRLDPDVRPRHARCVDDDRRASVPPDRHGVLATQRPLPSEMAPVVGMDEHDARACRPGLLADEGETREPRRVRGRRRWIQFVLHDRPLTSVFVHDSLAFEP